MALNNAAAAFIGAAVTLVLVIIFMILMVILVRQCLAFLAKRSAVRAQMEAQRQARADLERQRRGSITEPVPATFDWHHSIRIAGTPPPSYHEAKKLPAFEDAIIPEPEAGRKKSANVDVSVAESEPSPSEEGGQGQGVTQLTDVAQQRHVMVSIIMDDEVISSASDVSDSESSVGGGAGSSTAQ